MSETLTEVRETVRRSKNIQLFQGMNEEFILEYKRGVIKIGFNSAKANIGHGEEWATLSGDGMEVSINSDDDMWPHWLFEELYSIQETGGLRPETDYLTRYELSENRGIKGAK